jgi:septum formation protein
MHSDSARSIVLASTSPQRRRLLGGLGLQFDVVAPSVPEPPLTSLGSADPVHVVEALAYFKARSVQAYHIDSLVIGADTVVAAGESILGKPRDRREARLFLNQLSGAVQRVITGVALVDSQANRRLIEHDETRVAMREMDDETIERYLESGAWEGKAGGYGLTPPRDPNVVGVRGSVSGVLGLPIGLLVRMLMEWGIHVDASADPTFD